MSTNLKILFIDDEAITTKYFEKMFGGDFNIITTNDPKEGWKIIESRSNEIAVVICDQKMPDASGVDLLSKLRYQYPNIVRILTTAYANLEDNILAINQGNVFGYLTKPWKPEDVHKVIYDAVSEYKARLTLIALAGSIAHEIRNPLSSAGYAASFVKSTLEEAKAKSFDRIEISKKELSEILQMLEIASNCAVRGNMIIDMILNNIREKPIDKSKFHHITISSVIKAAMNEYAFGQDEKRRIAINIKEDFLFRGDETILVFVLFNLLKNAIYYMSAKPEASITITTSQGDRENFLYFKDTGPGVDPEKIPVIFESFVTSGKKNGTGLGLPFCKRAMESFSGSIECNSKLGEYTEFVLSFPRC